MMPMSQWLRTVFTEPHGLGKEEMMLGEGGGGEVEELKGAWDVLYNQYMLYRCMKFSKNEKKKGKNYHSVECRQRLQDKQG